MLIKDIDTHCPVHACVLHDGLVLVSYGHPGHSDTYRNAQAGLFPKSNFTVLGGCMLGEQITHEIRYCPQCREAHREWCAANNSTRSLPVDNEQLKSILEYRFGKQDCVKFLPDQVKEKLANNQKVAALKILQSANPGVAIAELKAHLLYLMRQPELEQVHHVMIRQEQDCI